MKNKEWMNIHLKAQSLGIVPLNKDMSYTRYTFWQNIRKNTMKKIDNRKQTGSGGGKDFKINEIDQLLLDIIRKDSPVVMGLPVADTWDEEPLQEPLPEPICEQDAGPSESSRSSSVCRKRRFQEDEVEKLRMEKLKLSETFKKRKLSQIIRNY
ncbi:hypothetical protein C0J52_24223 [Blattella germanica]|nr:hypothetical protein C0J52_24223 [Blattella germanica]